MEIEFEQAKNAFRGQTKRELKRAERRLEQFNTDWAAAKRWEEEENEAKLLQSHFHEWRKGQAYLIVQDWQKEGEERKIILDPKRSLKDELTGRFKRVRKLKRALKFYPKLVKKTEEEIVATKNRLEKFEEVKTLEELKTLGFKEAGPPKTKEEELPFRQFTSQSGFKIYVAKSAKNSERLTFSFAHGSDLWLHIADFPGAHVVIKGEKPDEETILDAAQLAHYFSKAKEEQNAEVIVTQAKYLSKARGKKPGLVNVSKHKKIRITKDPSRLARLLQKILP